MNTIHPMIKYCGNTSLEDLQKVVQSKANYIGFVFSESKRKVEAKDVVNWINQVDLRSKKIVGVFVNPTIGEIETVFSYVPLDVIQLHGKESLSFVKQLKGRYPKITLWKALHFNEELQIEIDQFHQYVQAFVVDSKVDGMWGGTGTRFDWRAVPFIKQFMEFKGKPYFIAGGINEGNIKQLLSYQPYGIDLASGIEEKSQKSMRSIKALEERLMN
ncbi:phosphoribosylanthranilate isomerase [Bacillus carboniphilus]|uniref:N-(5'-phosphoribosyl)anthranilate isomerase n=1 Tax=Bacillus carboniphilus TaxID=86663 RepID=A0ABY9JY92_9BACI|nr:phosphoribosylanthranilate isomerase [Bacillus carboniphilus]WLR43733.1 phosphoribosylanthranilate isomerase [Bacillus carboniphilus]